MTADFAALPPEINSTRMYAGPGSGPMLAGAAAWDQIGLHLESAARGSAAVLAELDDGGWAGPSAAAMSDAVQPYVQWTGVTAARARQTASQMRAAAAAYEAAFAATVPPAAVTANRIRLATLVATNLLGQNTPLIAATEAEYAAMWAQDAAAMFGYAGSAALAADVVPFTESPQTTAPGGHSAEAAAVAHAAGGSLMAHSHGAVSHLLTAALQHPHVPSATGPPGSPAPGSHALMTALSNLNILTGPAEFQSAFMRTAAMMGDFVNEVNLYGFQAGNVAAAAPPPPAGAAVTVTPVSPAAVVSVGRSEPVGRLAVPHSWTARAAVAGPPQASPQRAVRSAFRALPPWASESAAHRVSPAEDMGPIGRVMPRADGNKARRMRVRRFEMPRPAVGG